MIDVRQPPEGIPVATGCKRSGMRLLTVGTDCALGKKYTALALAAAFRKRGVDADFRATGQTGIMIAGSGMPMDAVVSDFLAGAAEMLSPDAHRGHWDVIEGQGSLSHPAYAAVSLGLLHGSAPDVLVLTHRAGTTVNSDYPEAPILPLAALVAAYEAVVAPVKPARVAVVALNTASLTDAQARTAVADAERETGLPADDVVRFGADRLLDAVLAALPG